MRIKSTDLLMIVAIVAIVLATVNLIITINKIGDYKTLSGLFTDTGIANLTIESNINVNFTVDNISWGTGYVPSGQTECELTTQGIMNCTNFNNISKGLTLENIGNADVALNLTASKGKDSFIGGTNPIFQWNVTFQNSVNGSEPNACPDGLNITTWTDVANFSGGTRACDNFTWRGTEDEIQVELRLVLPETAVGTKGVTITADAEAIA